MFDVAIVGSGYGGSVLAGRLAPHARVILLERGRRWKAGDFPATLRTIGQARLRRRNPLGLWDMRWGAGTGNAFALGFGGGSLVNYGISVTPDVSVFAPWPISAEELRPYLSRAEAALGARRNPAPAAAERAEEQLLRHLGEDSFFRVANAIDWSACTACGHCVPGCNVQRPQGTGTAKQSLDQTYLALAESAGAELQTGIEVVSLAPLEGGGYEVACRRTDSPQQVRGIRARHVVIAAGTFGTLDLLHRLRLWLTLSPAFGRNLSMNGDGLAFFYNTPHRLYGDSGASVTGALRLRLKDTAGTKRSVLLLSGRIPRAAQSGAALAMAGAFGSLTGERSEEPRAPNGSPANGARRRARDILGRLEGGALAHTLMVKINGQDDSSGIARFDGSGKAVIDWPDQANDAVFTAVAAHLRSWLPAVGGVLVPNVAAWVGRSFSVHALGGCKMGESFDKGVVDSFGRLWHPEGHFVPGLRVVDGSMLPGALGVPPSLTIAALAERASESLIAELAGVSPPPPA